MVKLEPIWQNLPPFFKQSVVRELDYKDRCCLRKCSKSDLDLVDSTPNHLNDVAINTFENYSFLAWSDTVSTVFQVKYFKNLGEKSGKIEFSASPRVYLPGKNQKIIFKKSKFLDNLDEDSDDLDMVLMDFGVIFKKLNAKNTVICDVIIRDYHPMAHPERTMEFRERLLGLIKASTMVKSQCLRLTWHQEEDERMEILKIFDPKSLKVLEFSDRNAFWTMAGIKKMEQWTMVKKCFLEVFSDLKMEDIGHFYDVQMHWKRIEEQELWKFIQNFISKNEHGSSFHFSYRQSDTDLDRILATFNVEPKNEPIHPQVPLRVALSGRFNHTQRFEMRDPKLICVVMIADKEVMGTVCYRNQVDIEAKVERGMLR